MARTRFYLSLQFFGDPEPDPKADPKANPDPKSEPDPTLEQITKHYEEQLKAKDAKIKDLQATIGVLCGGKPAPTPGDPAPKKGGNISPSLKALLR